jgi:hypothetical protein
MDINQYIEARYLENKEKIFSLCVEDRSIEGFYKDFKGKEYAVHGTGIVRISNRKTIVVIYQAMYKTDEFKYGQFWIIPYGMFFEKVVKDGYRGPRFKKIEKFY